MGMNKTMLICIIILQGFIQYFELGSGQLQCGSGAGNKVCSGNLCCSKYGYCGSTDPYCGDGCQSGGCSGGGGGGGNPPSGPSGQGSVSSIITSDVFESMLKHRNDQSCAAHGFYTYNAFVNAANSFNGFGTTGDLSTRKRELAAFFAQISHETTGGWASAPDGPYSWGLCFKEENSASSYCKTGTWPCAEGKSYHGRGPIQISWNYNYGPAGQAIGFDGINRPELVATDPTISFKTAVWFWMTAQANKPSSHAVMVGQWQPTSADRAANRLPGFGVTTNIINGGVECGGRDPAKVQDRIGFYKRYCSILGVDPGSNLDCANQGSF